MTTGLCDKNCIDYILLLMGMGKNGRLSGGDSGLQCCRHPRFSPVRPTFLVGCVLSFLEMHDNDSAFFMPKYVWWHSCPWKPILIYEYISVLRSGDSPLRYSPGLDYASPGFITELHQKKINEKEQLLSRLLFPKHYFGLPTESFVLYSEFDTYWCPQTPFGYLFRVSGICE